MKPKKIAFLKSGMKQRGGLEKYTKRLANAFSALGHEVVLLTTDCPDGIEEGYQIVNLGSRSKLSLVHLLRFDARCRNYIKENPCHIVFGMDRNFCTQTHYRAGNGVHAAYLERRKKQASFLKRLSFQVNPLHHLILQMEKKTYENEALQTLFTNSYMVKEEVLQYYNVPEEKIAVVHNGVEWHELALPFEKGLENRSQRYQELGLSTNCFQFLFIGNGYERKGLDLLLEALATLKNKDFDLLVCGKEKHPERYKTKAKALGLQKQVHFFGAVQDVRRLYSVSDAIVIPSMYDPFANVTVEALAMGLFVISSNANGGSEILKSENGVVFQDQNSPDELAECLKIAMQKPKTAIQATAIRNSVQILDYSNQLDKIITRTLYN